MIVDLLVSFGFWSLGLRRSFLWRGLSCGEAVQFQGCHLEFPTIRRKSLSDNFGFRELLIAVVFFPDVYLAASTSFVE